MNNNVGRLIYTYRMKKGMSQTQLAGRLGISNAFINRVELGKSGFPAKRLKEICKILDISQETFKSAAVKDFKAKFV